MLQDLLRVRRPFARTDLPKARFLELIYEDVSNAFRIFEPILSSDPPKVVNDLVFENPDQPGPF